MKRLLLFILLGPVFAGMAYADGSLEPFRGHKGHLTITGGTAPVQLMRGAARRIMTFNPDIEITVTGESSGAGIRKVGEGEAQIGNTGRPLREEEIKKYGLVSFPFAIDGVAVAVHPRNPVTELSKAQLEDIYNGRITNWREVGGHDAPIKVYSRPHDSGARDTFEEKALNSPPEQETGEVLRSNGAMKTAISRDLYGIGYLALGHLDKTIKALKIDGMIPNQENAANGNYTVTRYLYMNTRGEPTGLTESFINYIFSPEGAELIRKAGYIPFVEKD